MPVTPPADSLLHWYTHGSRYLGQRAVLGTARSLVATGDFRLIRDDSLRAAILGLLEAADAGIDRQNLKRQWLEANDQAFAVIDFATAHALVQNPAELDSLARAEPTFFLPEGLWRAPFPVDIHDALRNRDFYQGVLRRYRAQRSIIGYYQGCWRQCGAHAGMWR